MRSTVGASLALLTLAAVPKAARAQAEWTIGPFLSYSTVHGGHPATAGLATSVLVGPIGLRASGFTALDQPAATSNAEARWGGDADLMLIFDIASRGSRGGGLAPYVFAGAGMAVHNDTNFYLNSYGSYERSQYQVAGGFSYGAGILLPIGSALEAMGEIRQRPSGFFNTQQTNRTVRNEFRVGLSLRLGGAWGHGYRASPAAAAAPPRPWPSRRVSVTPKTPRAPDESDAGAASASTAADDGLRVILSGVGEVSDAAGASAPAASAARVVPVAERYLGTPYVYGGTSPVTGFDCSGFVQYVFAKNAVKLPRTSRQQATVGRKLPARVSALRAGDLMMFATSGHRISHVAIYAGRGRIIHASSSAGEVRFDDLATARGKWFVTHLVAARRAVPNGNGLVLDLERVVDVKGLRDTALDAGDAAPRR